MKTCYSSMNSSGGIKIRAGPGTSLSELSLLPVTLVEYRSAELTPAVALLLWRTSPAELRALTSRAGARASPAEIISVTFYQNTVLFLRKQLYPCWRFMLM